MTNRLGGRIREQFRQAGVEPWAFFTGPSTAQTLPLCASGTAACFSTNLSLVEQLDQMGEQVNIFPLMDLRQVFYGAAVRLHRRAGPDSRPPGGRRRGSCGKKCGKCVNRRRKRGEETGKIEETPEISQQKIGRDSRWRFEGICGIIKETKRRRGGNPPAEAKRFPGGEPRQK